jgi:hypothetical protein
MKVAQELLEISKEIYDIAEDCPELFCDGFQEDMKQYSQDIETISHQYLAGNIRVAVEELKELSKNFREIGTDCQELFQDGYYEDMIAYGKKFFLLAEACRKELALK